MFSAWLESLAERTGLEPATPGVTGRYSNQLNYRSAFGGANAIGLNNKATSNFGCTRSVTPAGVSATAPSSPKAGRRICPTRTTSTEPALRRFVQHPFRHGHNLLRNHYVAKLRHAAHESVLSGTMSERPIRIQPMMKLSCAVLGTLAAVCVSAPALAALGGDATSVESDRASMKGALRVT